MIAAIRFYSTYLLSRVYEEFTKAMATMKQ